MVSSRSSLHLRTTTLKYLSLETQTSKIKSMLSLTNIVICLVTIYIARRIFHSFATSSRLRALAAQKGCLPCPQRPSWFFGVDTAVTLYRSYASHTFLAICTSVLRSANAHTLRISLPGQQLFLTDDPENMKTMLATDFDSWSLGADRIEEMSSYLGHGVFTNEGASWKASRDMLRPCFEKHAVANLSLFAKHFDRLSGLLTTDGTTMDLQPWMFKYALDVATEFLFGQSTDSLVRENAEVDKFVEAFEYCGSPMNNENYKRWGYVGLLMRDGKRKESAKVVKDFADKIIDEHIAAKEGDKSKEKESGRYIFLDSLLAATSDRTVIRSELLNILLAGRETTASLLSNTFWLLSRHSRTVTRLRTEIIDTIGVGNEIPTYDQLKNMPYLRAIIHESQRLYPIVPSNSRQALRDTTLPHGSGPDGHSPILIPAGKYVVYHTFSMYRRRDIFGEDADEFRPERWLEPGFRPGWAFAPFSGGPRVCIGQNFANTQAMFLIVRMIQIFEIEGRDRGEWRERLSLTCVGDGGCKVGLTRR